MADGFFLLVPPARTRYFVPDEVPRATVSALETTLDCTTSCQPAALEATHEWCVLQYAQSLARHRPQLGAAWLSIGGGHAIYAGRSPFTFAIGLAMGGPISAAELDQIEAFFHSRGAFAKVDVCPFAHPSLLKLLETRGYHRDEVTTVLCRDLAGEIEILKVPPEVTVRRAEAREVGVWVDTMARSFFASDPGPEARANLAAMFAVPGSLNTLAFVDGELGGVAGGMLPPPGTIAPLFGSCTLPRFRRRGVHAAMLNFRLRWLRDHGCPRAVVTTIPGSDSERNVQRYGFRMAYEKQAWVKAAGEPANGPTEKRR